MIAENPNQGLANINPKLLLDLQRILVRHVGRATAPICEDINKRILNAASEIFMDDHTGVCIAAFRQVEQACKEGIEMSGLGSTDAQDYREVLSAIRTMVQE